jgi:hypothetical protein
MIAERMVVGAQLDPLLSLKALAEVAHIGYRTLKRYIAEDEALARLVHRPSGSARGKALLRWSEFNAWLDHRRERLNRQREVGANALTALRIARDRLKTRKAEGVVEPSASSCRR